MNVQDFIKKYGDEPQEVTKNYSTKSLGTNYNIKDAFIEFGDNSYDARISGKTLNFDIKVDSDTKTFTILDDGSGVSDDKNLFKLGGTDKEKDKNKVGKFGIGVPGAVAAIATKCVANKEEIVETIYKSAHNGRMFEKHIATCPNGETILGETTYNECDASLHYTKITFTNVELKAYTEIIDSMEETFEEPLHKDLNMSFNGRQLGKSSGRTFVGDESVIAIQVGKFPVKIRYRIIGGESNDSKDRAFDEAGLRVYDEKTGRPLAKNVKLWKWYGNKEAQQNICGLRAAIYIEGSIESYKKFGVVPAKNGIAYAYYYNDPDFAELTDRLQMIYNQAARTAPSTSEGVITLGGRTFQATTMKMDEAYLKVGQDSYLIKKKYTTAEMAEIINELITLKKKCEKKASKVKGVNNE
jgi:hypothetical protein